MKDENKQNDEKHLILTEPQIDSSIKELEQKLLGKEQYGGRDDLKKDIQLKIFHLRLQSKSHIELWLDHPLGVSSTHSIFGDHSSFMDLMECACPDYQFDRVLNSRRRNAETLMLKKSLAQYPPEEHFIFNYFGLGSYGLLQDFIMIGKLIAGGYKNFHIVLAEPAFDPFTKISIRLAQFKSFLNILKTTYQLKNIEVHFYDNKNFDEIKSDINFPKQLHLVNAIDYDQLYHKESLHAVVESHKLLDEKGLFFLSFKNYDFLLGKQDCIKKLFYKYELREVLWRDVFKKIKQHVTNTVVELLGGKNLIRYTSITPHFFFQLAEMVEIIPVLQTTDKREVRLTLCDFVGNSSDDYAYLLRLFSPNLAITISLKSSIEEMFETKLDEPKEDIVTAIGEEAQSFAGTHHLLRLYRGLQLKGGHQIIAARLGESKTVHPGLYQYCIWSQTGGLRPTPLDGIKNKVDELKDNKGKGSPRLTKSWSGIITKPGFSNGEEGEVSTWIDKFVVPIVPNPEPLPEPTTTTCRCTIA